jgi:predicted histone-like DNA-binding protein
MGNYFIREMATGMGNGKKGRIYPKMQVYSEFDYDKVVELINTYSPAFSQGIIRGVLDTLALVMKSYLPMGHTLKIDNLGVFSLALEFADSKTEGEEQKDDAKNKYWHVRAKDINFKVDKKLIGEINRENDFERSKGNPTKSSPYSLEERQKRALRHIDKHGFITLQEYANLNELSYSSASRELARLVVNPNSGIKAKGAGSHKVWVNKE